MSLEYNTYKFISGGPGTTVVKTGRGVLKGIAVTSLAVGGVIVVYDNTSAALPVIASITIAGLAAAGGFTPYDLDLKDVTFTTGLTVVTSGKAQNLTVTYE